MSIHESRQHSSVGYAYDDVDITSLARLKLIPMLDDNMLIIGVFSSEGGAPFGYILDTFLGAFIRASTASIVETPINMSAIARKKL